MEGGGQDDSGEATTTTTTIDELAQRQGQSRETDTDEKERNIQQGNREGKGEGKGKGKGGGQGQGQQGRDSSLSHSNVRYSKDRVENFWYSFKLEERMNNLDEVALEIADFQETSVSNRKKLASETKNFKREEAKAREALEQKLKLEVDGKVSDLMPPSVGPLMKSYQEEIDRLTKRARYSESQFLSLYKDLSEAPDPSMIVEENQRLSSRVSQLEYEQKKLKAELNDYETEFSTLKNQDITIRELETKVETLEQNKEQEIARQVEERTAELQQKYASSHIETSTQDSSLRERLNAAESEANEQRQAAEEAHTKLFELRSDMEEREALKQEEIDMANEELARSSSKIAELEHKLKKVTESKGKKTRKVQGEREGKEGEGKGKGEEEEKAGSHNDARTVGDHADGNAEPDESDDESSSSTAYQPQSHHQYSSSSAIRREQELEEEMNRWRGNAERAREELTKCKSTYEKRIKEFDSENRTLKQSLEERNKQVQDLDTELKQRPTQQEVKDLRSQLELLNALEYSAGDSIDEDAYRNQEITGNRAKHDPSAQASDRDAKEDPTKMNLSSAEKILLSRVRKVESTATELRVQLANKTEEANKANARVNELEELCADRQALIEKMEEALGQASAQWGNSTALTAGKGHATTTTNTAIMRGIQGMQGTSWNKSDHDSASSFNDSAEIKLPYPNESEEASAAVDNLLSKNEDGVATTSANSTDSPMSSSTHMRPVESSSTDGTIAQDTREASTKSMVHILHEQRDRFRQRILELEAERDDILTKERNARTMCEQLKNDNVSLLEKVRFLQRGISTHSSASTSTSMSSLQKGSTPNDTTATSSIDGNAASQGAAATDSHAWNATQATGSSTKTKKKTNRGSMAINISPVESRYESAYEDRVNPFADFTRRERKERYQNLSVAEKFALSVTKFFLTNRYTRAFVFFYAVSLHLLVFGTIWMYTHTVHGKCT